MIGPGPPISGGSLRFCPSPDTQHQCPDHWLLSKPASNLESAGITLLTSEGKWGHTPLQELARLLALSPHCQRIKGLFSRPRDTFLDCPSCQRPHRPWVMAGLWLRLSVVLVLLPVPTPHPVLR